METKTVTYQKCSMFRRISAFFFDTIVLLAFFVFFDYLVVSPIIDKCTNYNTLYKEYCEVLTDSDLYIYYSETDTVKLISSDYETHLQNFYNDNVLGYSMVDYEKIKYENSNQYLDSDYVFLYEDGEYTANIYVTDDDGNYVLSADGKKILSDTKQTALNEFYSGLVSKLSEELLKKDEIYALSYKLSSYEILRILFSLIPSVFITSILFPIIFKDGATLGKKILQMKVVDLNTGYTPTFLKRLVRSVYFVLINVAIGIMTFGIAIAINFIIMGVTKRHQAMHDIIAKTVVVRSVNKEKVSASEEITLEVYDAK